MSHELDRILGELQQEVEELTADLERQGIDFNIDKHQSRSLNNSIQTSLTGDYSSESDIDLLSLEDIEEEVAKIGSSLKKQPLNIPSSSTTQTSSATIEKIIPSSSSSVTSSRRSSASSLHSQRGKLQRPVSPALTALQTSFINSNRINTSMDSSNSSSPKSANTISPLSPRGIDSLHAIISPNFGQTLENSLPQKDIVNIVPKLGLRQMIQLNSDDDSDSSDNSDSETDSDADSDSDYNPLSMTPRRPLKTQRSMTDLAIKSRQHENLKRSVSNGNKANFSKPLKKHTPSPPSSANTDSSNTQQSKIKRRPTTAHIKHNEIQNQTKTCIKDLGLENMIQECKKDPNQ
ncbi:3542_t:CDS:2 [Ambispora leptoticha]|uniref:3542_t:CDS:1 n=1 Tax=Ambispora leptoticha TaxID=144679 RepID=A0A9N9AI92_9GLOM|nr:3542_t:CDS:2 [Ambispora leptoticha]